MADAERDPALELARKCVDICFGPNTSRPTNQYVDRVAALLRLHVWQWIPVGERLPQLGLDVLIYSSEWSTGILIDHREECSAWNGADRDVLGLTAIAVFLTARNGGIQRTGVLKSC